MDLKVSAFDKISKTVVLFNVYELELFCLSISDVPRRVNLFLLIYLSYFRNNSKHLSYWQKTVLPQLSIKNNKVSTNENIDLIKALVLKLDLSWSQLIPIFGVLHQCHHTKFHQFATWLIEEDVHPEVLYEQYPEAFSFALSAILVAALAKKTTFKLPLGLDSAMVPTTTMPNFRFNCGHFFGRNLFRYSFLLDCILKNKEPADFEKVQELLIFFSQQFDMTCQGGNNQIHYQGDLYLEELISYSLHSKDLQILSKIISHSCLQPVLPWLVDLSVLCLEESSGTLPFQSILIQISSLPDRVPKYREVDIDVDDLLEFTKRTNHVSLLISLLSSYFLKFPALTKVLDFFSLKPPPLSLDSFETVKWDNLVLNPIIVESICDCLKGIASEMDNDVIERVQQIISKCCGISEYSITSPTPISQSHCFKSYLNSFQSYTRDQLLLRTQEPFDSAHYQQLFNQNQDKYLVLLKLENGCVIYFFYQKVYIIIIMVM
ncbi:hypothetical protein GEMRC1_010999 [Eukaryota sp. GEM-RC1]